MPILAGDDVWEVWSGGKRDARSGAGHYGMMSVRVYYSVLRARSMRAANSSRPMSQMISATPGPLFIPTRESLSEFITFPIGQPLFTISE